MRPYDELIETITGDYSSDYWADDVSVYARSIFNNFEDDDWQSLNLNWNLQPEIEKIRLCEILSSASSDKAVPLLIQILMESTDDEITESAVESLRSIGDGKSNIIVSPELLSKLKTHAAKQTGLLSKTMPLLFQRLESK